MKLLSFLFEESNEETIANVILGIEKSTDPEDLKYDREKKGLEDFEVDTIGDIHLFETKAKAIRLPKTDKEFFDNLLAKQNVFEHQATERGFFRIQPKEALKKELSAKNISKEEFEKILIDAKKEMFAGLPTPEEIDAGTSGSGSGRYTTYVVTDGSVTIRIVICAGGNKGHEFESQIEYEVKNKRGENWENLICFLLQKGLIKSIDDFYNYKIVDKSTKVTRPLVNINNDVGEKLSDLTLFVNTGKPIYVSLKGDKGATFANLGAGGSFISEVEIDSTTLKKICKVTIGDNPNFFNFLNDAGVDPELVRAGYEAYGNGLLGNEPKYSKIKGITNPKIMDWLAASLGYGYVYFRRTPSGGYRIYNLDTSDAIKNVVGEFEEGSISYPYFMDESKSSKQCTIKVTTTTASYDIEIRSSQGGQVTAENFINSLECKVRVTKVNLAGNKDFEIDPKCREYMDWYFHAPRTVDENFHKLGKLKLGNLLF